VEDIEVVGECLNGVQVIEYLESNELPNIILLDINMPEMNGVETTRIIRRDFPMVQTLILSMYDTPEFIRNVVNAGASGYVLKNTNKNDLLAAIRTVSHGEKYYASDVVSVVMDSMRKNESGNLNMEITEREKEVMRLIADGLTTNEIADKLFISAHTVNTHRKNLLSKLNIKNTASLVRYALDQGIV
jgi:DNA-binding NarL/FixJ family response regulator